MEAAAWSQLSNSETLEDRLPKNCDGELTRGGRAGVCSRCVNSISGGEGSGVPDRTLCPPMSEGTTEPASTSLAIVRIWGLLLVAGRDRGNEPTALGLSSKAVGLRKRQTSSLQAFSILAFGTSASLARKASLSAARIFLSSSKSRAAVALVMLNIKPTDFGRISNSDISVAFLDEFDRIVQTLGRFRRILNVLSKRYQDDPRFQD